jgi:hypothetical protein
MRARCGGVGSRQSGAGSAPPRGARLRASTVRPYSARRSRPGAAVDVRSSAGVDSLVLTEHTADRREQHGVAARACQPTRDMTSGLVKTEGIRRSDLLIDTDRLESILGAKGADERVHRSVGCFMKPSRPVAKSSADLAEYLICARELAILTFQRLQALWVVCREARPLARIPLRLADPQAPCLAGGAEPFRTGLDRRPRWRTRPAAPGPAGRPAPAPQPNRASEDAWWCSFSLRAQYRNSGSLLRTRRGSTFG